MTDQTQKPRPVVLCIMDGWGQRAERDNNAVLLANTPNVDRLTAAGPSGRMRASGADVGLPVGQMGNSEVGHMNLGAGRVVMQDLPRIDAAVADGSLAANAELLKLIEAAKAGTGRCHLLGLTSPGGVHAHQTHIAALARALTEAGVEVLVHAFLDGRDTPPKSARADIERLLRDLPEGARIATISGRFYAMDRDKRWERVEQAYKVIAEAEGNKADDPLAEIDRAYAAGETDEFVTPAALPGYDGVRDGDVLLSANFRADRMREILAALLDPAFDGFARKRPLSFAAAAGMVSYSAALDPFLSVLFPAVELRNTLGETVANAGLTQLRMAETEKYPHVTFFLNGGREEVFEGEDRIMVPSPKVRTYDLQPEMSAPEVTEKLVAAIESRKYDLIVVNYANPDMVGHTGSLEAAIKAVETVDGAVGQIETALKKVGGCMFLTADHGNCEQMLDPETGGPHTAHTTNLVPTVLVNAPAGIGSLATGRLADVAPTLLELMGVDQPAEMTGSSMLRASAASAAE
ncbi:MAG: 2,3-bisphosphoglycerate-independent phosphoglycerate mutase [Nisaea sp.]|uniref:2,3-bisphosphoglycerate-independent phosphoglycerate mutase n=1 Tax=Nisaea sp. TaxID=2024842 RepID=UPI001B090892|nr:2,3-bisphosphoglycerate-independent phosphoglycerate mutase [Nisaea sp.]MBO6559882.1 2,3-bisphosphoglycerate-independent phosphoglycerate mutase [Nisaea sp.]